MSYTVEFCQYLLGLRPARTSDSEDELSLLSRLSASSKLVVEVGVFEGVASARMAACLPPEGRIVLVDPYCSGVLLERLLGFSMAETIARRTVLADAAKVTWIRKESALAAGEVAALGRPDLIFIDARHEYEYVAQDFHVWAPLLNQPGVLAFHDSQTCLSRPDLNSEVGSVRFIAELTAGLHGPWERTEVVDSITVIKRAGFGRKGAHE